MAKYLLFYSKIVELEEELKVVGNNLKSLEVSEEKVGWLWWEEIREIIRDPEWDGFHIDWVGLAPWYLAHNNV